MTFHSHLLNRKIQIRTTAYALRCIDKYGGIDAYIMFSPRRKLADSDVALGLRNEMEIEYQQTTGKQWDRRQLIYEQVMRGDRRRGRWPYDLTPLQLAFKDRLPAPIVDSVPMNVVEALELATAPTQVTE